jgi:hypothetical protein
MEVGLGCASKESWQTEKDEGMFEFWRLRDGRVARINRDVEQVQILKIKCLFNLLDDITISSINNTQRTDTEVFSARSSEINVVSSVMMDSGLTQHGVVL